MTGGRAAHLLVIEGNTRADRTGYKARAGETPSEAYAAVLRRLVPGARVDVGFPGDGTPLPDALDAYDGVVLTGSSLHIYERKPEAVRQVECARAVFASGAAFFGSCWGLQVACVAAGGDVRANPRGTETGFARGLTLTEAGLTHPLHAGRPAVFDAPAMHRDEVATLPPDVTVTAGNAMSAVHGAEIRSNGGVFWGVQFHPEFSLREIAVILRGYGIWLVEGGFFDRIEALDAYCADLLALDQEPHRKDIAWRYGFGPAILDPVLRMTEIQNWITHRLRPAMSARGRA